jgi:integrase/recombinase XerD
MIEQQPLTVEQVRSGIEAARLTGPREHALAILAANHGLRASELARVKVADLNLAEATIKIKPGKGSLSSVEKMTPTTIEVVNAWLAAKPSSPYIFPSPSNPTKPISRIAVYNIFRALAEKARLPESSRAPHAWRHSLGQALADNGLPVQTIARALRHKSISSTMHYFTLRQSQVDELKAKAIAW